MVLGILELAIVFSIAAALGILAYTLKQPTILAYIFTGIIIGIFGFSHLQNSDIFETLSALGIMFLLFLIGMEMNYDSLRLVGKTSLILGLGQILFTSVGGYIIAMLLGFSAVASLYIAITLTFSSTIIIIKLLSEKKELYSLHGKISIGFLLVQDFVAMLILLALAGITTDSTNIFADISWALVNGIVLFVVMLFLGRKFIPLVMDKISRSIELLFLISLAWCLGVATAVAYFGFSIEIGGFLAGLALANSSERYEISSKIKPLRDFFILIFFVILGSSLVFSEFLGLSTAIIIFSLFVLIGNPLIVIFIMGRMGYRSKTSFMAGTTVAQISEFSLIVAALGLRLGHIDSATVSLITIVGILTITISTYLIAHSDKIYLVFEKYLKFFEKKIPVQNDLPPKRQSPIVLIGAHRIGQNIASILPKEKVLIIDFDPDIIKNLESRGFTTLFGDINDEDIKEAANLDKVEILICTSPIFETNEEILETIKRMNRRPLLVLRAESEEEARVLYKRGADYVIIPHLTAGQALGRALLGKVDTKLLQQLKAQDIGYMKKSVMKSD